MFTHEFGIRRRQDDIKFKHLEFEDPLLALQHRAIYF